MFHILYFSSSCTPFKSKKGNNGITLSVNLDQKPDLGLHHLLIIQNINITEVGY